MFYLVKTPWVVKKLMFPNYIWDMPDKGNKIYLTFDDGPHPTVTPFVLDQLKQYNAKATFFCIGKNVDEHPDIYKRVINDGHSVGNHTYDHLNGWSVTDKIYLKNIVKAEDYIESTLFRPPYGKVTRFQAKQLIDKLHYNIIMWSVLSGDFDVTISPEECWQKVSKAITPGSIIVFHDSEKAKKRLMYTLPKLLKYYKEKDYSFEKIVL